MLFFLCFLKHENEINIFTNRQAFDSMKYILFKHRLNSFEERKKMIRVKKRNVDKRNSLTYGRVYVNDTIKYHKQHRFF